MRGTLKHKEVMASHTSWHIGGPADSYYCPSDIDDLTAFLQQLPPDEPLTWLGLGSNVLISDAGLRGTVIHTLGMEPGSPTVLSSGLVRAEASIPCAKLAKFCAEKGFSGGSFFSGIPGTIGGALVMNAGAFGGETWLKVAEVEVIDRKGMRAMRSPSDYQISYRKVRATIEREEWFIAAHFRFELGVALEAKEQIKQLLRKRADTQPIGVFSCGSVFKNPPGDHAARLIESCGLKGYEVGAAHISPKHANFIINTGKARAEDVLQIIHHIQKVVFEQKGVRLEPEVRMLGF